MPAIDHLPLRRAIIDTALKMNASGINQGTSGNISVRAGSGFLITPTGIPYEELEAEDIVEMDFDGGYAGRHRPSSEWRFHRDILKARPDAEAVLHDHSIFATSLSCHDMEIPAFHYMVGVAGGTTIRCAEYATFGTRELSANALKALEDRTACLLSHHGVICIAGTLKKALWLAVEVETMAKQYVHVRMLGNPKILSDEEMGRVLEQMRRMSYGQAPDLEPGADTPHARES